MRKRIHFVILLLLFYGYPLEAQISSEVKVTVSSPDEAHQGQKNYTLYNEQSEIIGFFSTEHKAIFTHHDTYLHMHLITADRQKMGHLDDVRFKKGTMMLYLPTR